MLKKRFSLAVSLALFAAACSGGGGGGSSDDPADIAIAQSLSGTWDVTYTTGALTNCPGNTVGSVGTGTVTIKGQAGSATLSLDVSEGGGTDSYSGVVRGGVFQATYSVSDGSGTINLSISGGRLIGNDTFRFTQPTGCVLETLIDGTLVSGGAGPFTASELEGSYRFTATVTESNNSSLPVGTTEPMAIVFNATGTNSFDATMLLGPFAQAELVSVAGDVTKCSGTVNLTDLLITISRVSASAPFTIALEAREVLNSDVIRATGTLTPQLVCAPVTGTWAFDFGGGEVITGEVSSQFCSLFVNGSGSNQRMSGILDANGLWQGGVAFGQVSGAEAAFSGTFNGDTFTGTWDNGSVTGTKQGGTSNCVAVAAGVWNLEFSVGGVPQLDFSGGSMTQNGCALSFNYSFPGADFTLTGDLNGNGWVPAIGGVFGGAVSNVDIAFNSSGNSLTGTATISGQGGPLSATVTGSKQ